MIEVFGNIVFTRSLFETFRPEDPYCSQDSSKKKKKKKKEDKYIEKTSSAFIKDIQSSLTRRKRTPGMEQARVHMRAHIT